MRRKFVVSDMLRTELEMLTGKLIRGDLTPVVYDLIKDSPFKDDLLEYSSTVREETEDVIETRLSRHADNNGSFGIDFKDWLANEVQPISVSRYEKNSRGKAIRCFTAKRKG